MRPEELAAMLLLTNIKVLSLQRLPNGYCGDDRAECPICAERPWWKVTTEWGGFTLGWRKRVIAISWEPSVYN